MKRTLLAALLSACIAVPSFAQTAVSVQLPANLNDPVAVAEFRQDVANAIRSVCTEVEGPVLALQIYGIRKCIAETSRDVARLDGAGVLSAELLRERAIQLAAK